MTDDISYQSVSTTTTEPRSNDHVADGVEFAYPQLLLEASLQSLLTHSYSSEASTVVNMSQPPGALSESWTSISDIDYSQEDDLQSENTDTGSLIDASSIQDIHSVNDSGDASESEESEQSEEHEEPQSNNAVQGYNYHEQSVEDYDVVRHGNEEPTAAMRSTGRLASDDSQSTTSDDGLDSSFESTGAASDDTDLASRFVFPHKGFSLSRPASSFDQGDRPFRILYLETKSVNSDHKAAVLQKIGAALISRDSRHRDSSSYHVIPSEFGPGAKPDTSELIPVTRQLTVYECALPRSLKSGSINLKLVDGSPVVCSRNGTLIKKQGETWQRPDLALDISNENDTDAEKQPSATALTYLQKCDTPTLSLEARSSHVLRTAHAKSASSRRSRELKKASTPPMSIQQFLEVDTDDLNQILASLVENKDRQHESSLTESYLEMIQRAGSVLVNSVVGMWNQKSQEVRQHRIDNSSEPSPKIFSFIRQRRRTEYVRPATLILAVIVSICLPMIFGKSYMTFEPAAKIDQLSQSASWQNSKVVSAPAKPMPAAESKKSIPTTTSKSTDMSLLSGMLQDVAEYWPSHRSASQVTKQHHSDRKHQEAPARKASDHGLPKTFVNLHRGGVLKVSEDFYREGKPDFSVRISRGKRSVTHKSEDMRHGGQLIKVDNSELHGLLKILLSSNAKSGRRICAHVNLEGTPLEKVAGMIEKNRQGRDEDSKALNEWILVRVRKSDTSQKSVFRDALQFMAQQIESSHAIIEDKALSQILACSQRTDECWLLKARKYEKKLTAAATKARNRADILANVVASRSHKAVSSIRQTKRNVLGAVSRMKQAQSKVMTKLTRKAEKAQSRARKLLKKRNRR